MTDHCLSNWKLIKEIVSKVEVLGMLLSSFVHVVEIEGVLYVSELGLQHVEILVIEIVVSGIVVSVHLCIDIRHIGTGAFVGIDILADWVIKIRASSLR